MPANQLEEALRARGGEVLESWMDRFERSSLRFQRTVVAATYANQAANLIDTLTIAASAGADELRPGATLTRELERSCAFLGAQLSGAAASGFDVAAFLLSLRDAARDHASAAEAAQLDRLFEWLTVVALDSFAAAGLQSLRERTTEQLEAGTPVLELLPKVPAILFVGGPTNATMDALLSRGVMLSIGTGSACLILDVTGLAESALRQFPKTFAAFLLREAPPSIELVLVGAPRSARDACREAAATRGHRVVELERLDAAIEHVLGKSGQRIV